MLKIILENGLSNVLVVVTRYFGGILLGTGGLVRAYSDVTKKAIEKAKIIQKTRGYEAKIQIEYDSLETLKYYLKKQNIKIINTNYEEKIEVIVEIPKNVLNEFTNNYNNNKFQIIKFDTVKEKFIEI